MKLRKLTLKDLVERKDYAVYQFVEHVIWETWRNFISEEDKDHPVNYFNCTPELARDYFFYCVNGVHLLSLVDYLSDNPNEIAKIVNFCRTEVDMNRQNEFKR